MATTTTTELPAYAPVPRSAIGPTLNEQGYYVGRVERNLYWITDGTYQSAFLTTSDGVVLLDAPPTIGHNIQRAVDEIAPQAAIRAEPAKSVREQPGQGIVRKEIEGAGRVALEDRAVLHQCLVEPTRVGVDP